MKVARSDSSVTSTVTIPGMRTTCAKFAALAVGVALSIASAPTASARVGAADGTCVGRGVVNAYAVAGEDVSIPVGGTPDTFERSLCRYGKGGQLRIYRSEADTSREVAVLRAWAEKVAQRDTPVLFCATGKTSGYFLDLAQPYAIGPVSLSVYEMVNYEPWAEKMAASNPACELARG